MSLRLPIALLALLLLAAAGALWLALSDSPTGGQERALSGPAGEGSQRLAPDRGELAPPPARPRGAEAEAARASSVEREAVVTAESSSGGFAIPGDALWIEGRVIFPPGTPLDEEVRVEASGKRFTKDRQAPRRHTAHVGPDGRFRVALGASTRKGFLYLKGRYLFLDRGLMVEPAKQEGEVVLEPRLGGAIRATILPPPGVEVTEADFGSLEITTYSLLDGQLCHAHRSADGSFELTGLPPGDGYELRMTSPRFADERRKEIAVLPGEVTEVELALRRGVRLAGRVVDADGAGLKGIELALRVRVPMGTSGYSASINRRTGEEGEFDLRGLVPGTYTLRILTEGYVGLTEKLGELEDGAVRENWLFTLETGLALEGRVLWPDGTPAAGASVAVRQVREGEEYVWARRDHSAVADSNGEFRVAGLGTEPVSVAASARRVLAIRDEGAGAGGAPEKARRPGKGPRWSGERTGVLPGTEGLILVLTPGETLRGRVVDDTGAPVPRFRLRADLDPAEKRSGSPAADPVRTSFRKENGEFELAGLKPGTWWVRVDGVGLIESSRTRVVLPADAPVELRVTRGSRLSGVVRSPAGAPVGGARVDLSGWYGTDADSVRSAYTTADEKGDFEKRDAPVGSVKLEASAPGWAPSSPLVLEVAPAEELEGLVLVLRRSARLTGEVHPAAAPIAGRVVRVRERDRARSWPTTETDGDGRFALEDLPPGTFTVRLEPPKMEPVEKDWAVREAMSCEVDVELLEGGSAHVVLGAPLANAIRVHGRVSARGKAAAGLVVRCERDDFSTAARCDESGDYELEVEGPGSYSFSVRVDDLGSVSFGREIAAGSSRQDFHLPDGSISGLVIGPGGEPAGWSPVSLELVEAKDGIGASGAVEQWTDDEGRFHFGLLRPGSYLLRAGGAEYDGQEDCGAIVLIDGLVLAPGETLEGLSVKLGRGGTLAGRVTRADGTTVEDAWIRVRDGKGRTLFPLEFHSSCEDGSFLCCGIPAGTFTVFALAGSVTSAEVTVEVVVGATSRADLVIPD